MREIIYNTSTDFFEKLGVDFSKLDVVEEAEKIFHISLHSEDSAILIGPHGKNLETLTHILKLLLSKILSTHLHIHLEINDYLAQKEEKLLHFIQKKITIAKEKKSEIELPLLTSYERKKVHSYISDGDLGVKTESRGDGSERRMFLIPTQINTITIDLDGDDI